MENNRYIPVDGHPNLVRDRQTNAILNINNDDIQTKMKVRAAKLKEREEIETLKNDVQEIKSLLIKLLEK